MEERHISQESILQAKGTVKKHCVGSVDIGIGTEKVGANRR